MNTVINSFTFISLVAVVVLIMRVRSVDKRLKATEAFIRGLISHAKSVPIPDDPKIHQGWLRRYNELEDSPKRTAYRNRLIEIGVMDEDGTVVREP